MAIKRPLPSFLIFKDKQGHWRWNFAAGNGKVVAASAVAYLRRQGCLRAIQVMKGSAEIPVVGRPGDLQDETPAATDTATKPDAKDKPAKKGG
ncbi:YegP family protein [Sphingosinicella rhizophila]|uniref:DUF1508 domain-containing protein n=1 Tax=Sphingosinicella rhizophila TaxID=3050082 RepID=A0ABU3Q4S4_9SPHN|nr:DUF1508 domain-containing protein [Sphingosinicella sp. GR2756]MDT9598302.1 DUF1508 domain-containing protein [Sphingosinicella sp. GR2756]